MASRPAKLIIVRRDKHRAFEMLNDWLKESADLHVMWDRRTGDDRRRRDEAVATECREQDRRRRPLDPSWNVVMPMAPDLWSVYLFIATRVNATTPREPVLNVAAP